MQENLIELLNLSKNEAKVYKTLIHGTPLDPAELASTTGLPRTRIYEVLSSLAAKKLLEKTDGSTSYRLIPPKEAMQDVIGKMNRDLKQKVDSIGEFSDYLEKVWHNSIASTISPGVSLLSLEDSENMFFEALKQAKQRVWIAAADNNPSIDMRRSGSILSSIYTDEMDIRYLISNPQITARLMQALQRFSPFAGVNIKIATNQNLYSSYVIIDNLCFIFFFGSQTHLKAMSLITSSENLSKTFEWTYETLWKDAIMAN